MPFSLTKGASSSLAVRVTEDAAIGGAKMYTGRIGDRVIFRTFVDEWAADEHAAEAMHAFLEHVRARLAATAQVTPTRPTVQPDGRPRLFLERRSQRRGR